MPDGSITFNTRIDNSEVAKDMKKVEREIDRSYKSIEKSRKAKMPLVEQSKDLSVQLDTAKKKLEQLKTEMSAVDMAMAPGAGPDDYATASAARPGIQAELKTCEKEVAALQAEWDRLNDRIDAYDREIQQATAALDENKAKAAKLAATMKSSGAKMSAAMDKAHASAQRFGRRLLEIGKSALIFSVISAGLRAIVSHTGKMLQTNKEYTAQLAQLKAALLSAFQPIYEFVLPGVLAVLRVLTAIVSVVASVLSFLTGGTLGQSANNAKALNEEAEAIGGVGSAAKEAEKSLASFDEINTLGPPEAEAAGGGGGAGGATADFSAFDTAEYKAKIDELTVYLSGALLALGAILAFSGVNIPLGLGLMAAGAIGLASVVKQNWGTMSNELKAAVNGVILMLSTAFLAIGAVLAFSGASIPIGISLMLLGAAGLATVTALNWSSIPAALQGPTGEVVAMISTLLLVLGLVLAFSGASIPLGIALIAAGAVGLVTVGALNWDAIQQKLAQTWEGIKQWFNTHVKPKLTVQYWQEKFSTISDALEMKIKDGVNAAIALVNKFIGWLNEKMVLKWSDFSVGGVQVVEAGSFQLLNIPKIPMLAQGAVLPANKPFLAMVGDQKNGTNVEAPLETIKQALAEVMAEYGNGDVNVNISGDLAPFIRWLRVEIDREKRRVGESLAGGNA